VLGMLARVRERMVEFGIGQAALMVRRGQREEGRLTTRKLEERGTHVSSMADPPARRVLFARPTRVACGPADRACWNPRSSPPLRRSGATVRAHRRARHARARPQLRGLRLDARLASPDVSTEVWTIAWFGTILNKEGVGAAAPLTPHRYQRSPPDALATSGLSGGQTIFTCWFDHTHREPLPAPLRERRRH
jgi:hypothetical protein